MVKFNGKEVLFSERLCLLMRFDYEAGETIPGK